MQDLAYSSFSGVTYQPNVNVLAEVLPKEFKSKSQDRCSLKMLLKHMPMYVFGSVTVETYGYGPEESIVQGCHNYNDILVVPFSEGRFRVQN